VFQFHFWAQKLFFAALRAAKKYLFSKAPGGRGGGTPDHPTFSVWGGGVWTPSVPSLRSHKTLHTPVGHPTAIGIPKKEFQASSPPPRRVDSCSCLWVKEGGGWLCAARETAERLARQRLQEAEEAAIRGPAALDWGGEGRVLFRFRKNRKNFRRFFSRRFSAALFEEGLFIFASEKLNGGVTPNLPFRLQGIPESPEGLGVMSVLEGARWAVTQEGAGSGAGGAAGAGGGGAGSPGPHPVCGP